MPRKKKVIPEYGTCIRKGIEYYRTRIVDSDGKRVSLYARTPEELYEKVQEAERLIAEASFRKENPTVNEYCEKWLLIQKGRLRTTTYTDYEWKVKKYIQKPLGNKYMTDVTPDDVNLAILPALSMSESVYRSAQMLYKLIFTAAEDSNVIKKSPCSKLSAKGGKPQKVKKALDFQVTPHQLRHTYITNLIYAGVDPKTVQYLTGHENSKITMDIYAKVKYNSPDALSTIVNNAFNNMYAKAE